MKCISLVIWNAYCYYLLLFCIRLSIATTIHTGYTIHRSIDSNTSVPSATSSVQNEFFFNVANQRPTSHNQQQFRHGMNVNAHLRHSTHDQRHHHNHQPLPYHQTYNNHSSTIIRNSIVESKIKQSHEHKGRNKLIQHTTTIPSKKTYARPMINRHHHSHHPHQWATHSNTAVTYTQSPYSINSAAVASAASMKRPNDDSNANWPKVFDTTTVAPEEIQITVTTTHPHSDQYKQQHHYHHTEAQLPSTLQSNHEYNRPLAAQNDISVKNERRKAQQRQINSQIPNRIDIALWNMVDDNGDGDTNIDSTNTNDHDDNNNDDDEYDVSKANAKINLQITSFSHYTNLHADNFHFIFNSHIFPNNWNIQDARLQKQRTNITHRIPFADIVTFQILFYLQ